MQMSGQKVQLQLATSVMKSIQDSQERQAQALIEMMKQMTPGVGQNIDIRA